MNLDLTHISHYQLTPKCLGRGSFGVVYEAIDANTQKKVAIKKIPFLDIESDLVSLYREISLLRVLKAHPNLISLEHVEIQNLCIYLVFEYHDGDLNKLIRSRQQLTLEHLHFFLFQILKGVEYLHSAKIVHRDLKPSNILMKSDGRIKICDFGLARAIIDINGTASEHEFLYLSDYVVTRWYRGPEVILRFSMAGDAPTDMWSVGCILAELILRKPIFPGASEEEVLSIILKLMGIPRLEANEWLDDCETQLKLDGMEIHAGSFQEVFKNLDADVRDLLLQLLEFNPCKRITARQALKHTCFQVFSEIAKFSNAFSLELHPPSEKASFTRYLEFEREFNHQRVNRKPIDNVHQLRSLIENEASSYITTSNPGAIQVAEESSLLSQQSLFTINKSPPPESASQQNFMDSSHETLLSNRL